MPHAGRDDTDPTLNCTLGAGLNASTAIRQSEKRESNRRPSAWKIALKRLVYVLVRAGTSGYVT